MRILVVEGERRMAELLRQGLADEGHEVITALSGPAGLSLAETRAFGLIILDGMLPGMNGFALARQLRSARNRVSILMLTARGAASDVAGGLDLGADDYLAKPFSFDVLLARVRALARRGPAKRPIRFDEGGLTLDTGSREVKRDGRAINLTRKEYAILELLMRNAGRVVSRDVLIENVWGGDSDIASNTLDAFMRLLRAKVEVSGEPKLIHTVRGVGFILRPQA
jgi:DNA-binding response OmpR family regulator